MPPEDLKRKLTAILSADVAGYSLLMRDDEEATVRTLTDYRRAMGNLIQQYSGRVVDSPGDNLLAEFASVVDAVNCAVEIQRELAERNAELPEGRRMEVRIGVNLGDVVTEGERIYGDGVNIAARIEGLAENGGICLSGTVYDTIEGKIGLEYEYLGEHEVKNIEKPVRMYRVLSFPAATDRVIQAKDVTERRLRNAAMVLALALAIVVPSVLIWNYFIRPRPAPMEPASVEKMAFRLPDRPSIAVLPFDNMSGDPEQEYFADGMTDDLITDLSSISGLFVIARNSTFTYKGIAVDVRQVAEELGVRYVLEGSVRRVGDRVRINVQLIDATSGHHLWADRYDGKLGDVFDLQDQMTQKIVSGVGVRLTGREKERFALKYMDNPAAYDTLLQGVQHHYRFTADDRAKAISLFEKAVGLDPNYYEAYAWLAHAYWSYHNVGRASSGTRFVETRLRARQYLKVAMKNPTPMAHRTALDMLLTKRLHEQAVAEGERALALDPNDAFSHMDLATALLYAGRPQEAIDIIRRAMRLDPLSSPPYLANLGLAHFCLGQYEETVELIEMAQSLLPQFYNWSAVLPAAYALLGRDDEARAALEDCTVKRRWLPRLGDVMFWYPFKDLKVAERLAKGLLKAGLPGEPSGYYKIFEENRLTGEEIKKLCFGRALVFSLPGGVGLLVHYTKDGRATLALDSSDLQIDPDLLSEKDTGTAWIEGDMLCTKYETSFKGLTFCQTVFRNPEGTPERKNEYIVVGDSGWYAHSVVD